MNLDPFRGVLGCDVETASAEDIDVGSWAYSLHPSTIVYVVCFAYAETRDGPRQRWAWFPGAPFPAELADFIRGNGALIAHNAAFERSIWRNILAPRFGLIEPSAEQWAGDTQARGLYVNLPSKLEGLASVLHCPTQKDLEGAALMLEMCRAFPDPSGHGWVYDRDPVRVRRLTKYCGVDVEATLDAHFRLPPLPTTAALEHAADVAINERGVYLDQRFAASASRLVELRAGELSAESWGASGFELSNSTGTPKLKAWLKRHGVKLPTVRKKTKAGWKVSETLDKAAVLTLLEDPTLPPAVRPLLEVRQEANKATSLSKLKRVPLMAGVDGRLRFALQFCSAHTGRWASSGLQLHNLPKNKLDGKSKSRAISELVLQAIEAEDLEALRFLLQRPLDGISQSLRSVVCAPPGFELIGADYAAIEARVVAWLAGQDDVLSMFARGEDVYTAVAHDLGSPVRDLGKVCQLGLGYGMGAVKLISTAAGAPYFIVLTTKESARVVKAWRGRNAAISTFWGDLEAAALDALAQPGRVVPCRRLSWVFHSGCLFMQLPSGRSIRYWKPRIVHVEKTFKTIDEDGNIKETTREGPELQFLTVNKAKDGMQLEGTYGGKLVENATQAVARDILAAATVRLRQLEERLPYRVVVHVHDSLVAEVPAGKGEVGEFETIVATLPPWAAECAMKAEGYRSTRFRG